jgi:hypothetical protein
MTVVQASAVPLTFPPLAALTPSMAEGEFARARHCLAGLPPDEALRTFVVLTQRLIRSKQNGFLPDKDIPEHLWVAAETSGIVEHHGADTVQTVMAAAIETAMKDPGDRANRIGTLETPSDSPPIAGLPAERELKRDKVTSVDLQDFLDRSYPPRELMLSPWLPRQGLAMAHGYRGFGKTLMAHGSAWAISTGGGFWRWKAPEPRRVLVIDGEMPAADLQSRLRSIQDSSELRPAPGFFRIPPPNQAAYCNPRARESRP